MPVRGPARRRRGALDRGLRRAAGRARLGMTDPPPARAQPEHEWALGLADRAIAEAEARGARIAVAVVDRRGEPIQQDAWTARRRRRRSWPRRWPRARRRSSCRARGATRAAVASCPTAAPPCPAGCRSRGRRRVVAGLGHRRRGSPGLPQIAAAVPGVRVCVVGCGAIGGLFAARLAAADDARSGPTTCRPSTSTRSTATACGRRRRRADRAVQARTDAREIPPCELGIVATKAMFTEAAMAATATVFADARGVQRAERDRQRGGRSPATCRA